MTAPTFNPLRDRLSAGLPCLGGWLTVPAPIVAEAMASLGFHWLTVDLEHGSADVSQVETICAILEATGVSVIVRIPELDADLGRRLLDVGARGLIVSTTEDAEAFADFSDHCLYPPAGRRGVGLSRCNLWGDRLDEYVKHFRPVLVPQVESRAGVGAAAALAALPFVDALFMGPYDLSADLGCTGDFDAPEFTAATAMVVKVCADNGKAAGIHQVSPDIDALRARIDEGYRLIAFATDMIAMRSALGGIRDLAADVG